MDITNNKIDLPNFNILKIKELTKIIQNIENTNIYVDELTAVYIDNLMQFNNLLKDEPNNFTENYDLVYEIQKKIKTKIYNIDPLILNKLLKYKKIILDNDVEVFTKLPIINNENIILYSYEINIYLQIKYSNYNTFMNKYFDSKKDENFLNLILFEVVPIENEQSLVLEFAKYINLEDLIKCINDLIIDNTIIYCNYISNNLIFPEIKGTYKELSTKVENIKNAICKNMTNYDTFEKYNFGIRQNRIIDELYSLACLNCYNTKDIKENKEATYMHLINCDLGKYIENFVTSNLITGSSTNNWIINNKPKNKETTVNYYNRYHEFFKENSLHINKFGPLVKKIIPNIIIKKNGQRFYTYSNL